MIGADRVARPLLLKSKLRPDVKILAETKRRITRRELEAGAVMIIIRMTIAESTSRVTDAGGYIEGGGVEANVR